MYINNKIKKYLKEKLSKNSITSLKYINSYVSRALKWTIYPYARFVTTPINLLKNKNKHKRYLEIGPGSNRVPEFETINVVWGYDVDYIGDASKKLPFASCSFDLIYASHVLEHISWYQIPSAIKEWVRILKPGGSIEIWVPNGLLIAQTFINAELEIKNDIDKDGWYKFNEYKDPCVWANGRIFSYGDGNGLKNDPNWHRALFTSRYLRFLLADSGLINISELNRTEVRGYDHGWINLGIKGYKP
jgi:SAM-dependent methyltransferase